MTDPDIVKVLWGLWPDANIGIPTGAVSGFVVVDIDPKDGGPASLVELEKRLGPLPLTVRSITGSGGEHILFRHPGQHIGNSAGQLAPGVDVRGDGGYIIAAGSNHKSGNRYIWNPDHHPDIVALADLPPAWLAAMSGGGRRPGGDAPAAPIIDETTGRRIDGREERARDIRREVFLDIQDATGCLPDLEAFAEESYQRFAKECETGPTVRSDNTYEWEGWWKACGADMVRLSRKFTNGAIPGVAPAHPSRLRLSIADAEKALTECLLASLPPRALKSSPSTSIFRLARA